MYTSLAWEDVVGQCELTQANLVKYKLLGFFVECKFQESTASLFSKKLFNA